MATVQALVVPLFRQWRIELVRRLRLQHGLLQQLVFQQLLLQLEVELRRKQLFLTRALPRHPAGRVLICAGMRPLPA
ncbi:hypothetical protein AB0K71_06340 [Streptomyces syringium]|uniref:hypothetical protein n=1 Tax=Streptomyces syringium TaxID=76729 RepID=UPI0033B7394A